MIKQPNMALENFSHCYVKIIFSAFGAQGVLRQLPTVARTSNECYYIRHFEGLLKGETIC